MRIPFPKTIPIRPLLIILMAMILVQLIQGTDPAFAVLMLVAQLAAAVAFNRMGGMTHMAGAFCLFSILPNVTVPEITHLLLRQSGDYNLQHPFLTASVCAVFFTCVMIAAFLVSSIRHPVAFLDHIEFSIFELRVISVLSGLFAVSIAIKFLTLDAPPEDGSLFAAVSHFGNILFIMSIMLATHVRIVGTNGKSVMSWYVALLLIFAIASGIISASKEGMLTPIMCWFLVVASSKYRFSWFGTLPLGAALFVVWAFVYPFSQNARFPVHAATTLTDKVDVIIQFFRDPSQFPDATSNFEESSEYGTASSKVNIIKRYSLLQSIDMLVDADQRSGYTSFDRYVPALFSIIPHALWPDRPVPISSNELGHKAGFSMNEEDTATGIEIGSPALFFDMGGWLAVIVYALLCFTVYFLATVRLLGTLESGVWGLVPIGVEAHLASCASPAGMFSLLVTYLGMFFLMVAMLKMFSYIATTLVSRPITT
jgi:hypothetical protein